MLESMAGNLIYSQESLEMLQLLIHRDVNRTEILGWDALPPATGISMTMKTNT